MNRSVLGPLCSVLLLASLSSFGCGSSGQLRSVTVSPSAADARNFPSGQVPFSAMGTFGSSSMPQPLNNKDIVWCVGTNTGACAGNIIPGATVTPNGVAACVPTFSGTTTILAGKANPLRGAVRPGTEPGLESTAYFGRWTAHSASRLARELPEGIRPEPSLAPPARPGRTTPRPVRTTSSLSSPRQD